MAIDSKLMHDTLMALVDSTGVVIKSNVEIVNRYRETYNAQYHSKPVESKTDTKKEEVTEVKPKSPLKFGAVIPEPPVS